MPIVDFASDTKFESSARLGTNANHFSAVVSCAAHSVYERSRAHADAFFSSAKNSIIRLERRKETKNRNQVRMHIYREPACVCVSFKGGMRVDGESRRPLNESQ